MRNIKSFLIGLSLCFSPFLSSSDVSQQEIKDYMCLDLDIIKNVFNVKYAPAEWKRSYAGWDLEEQINLAKLKVQETSNISLKDYHGILQKFFNSTRDYHVGVSFFSTEAAFLPFRVHSANGNYYIAWSAVNQITKGDEVLKFNGKPVDSAIQKIRSDLDSLSPTDQALAEAMLTMRIGASGDQVPSGSGSITVRKLGTNKIVTYKFNWYYFPEEIHTSLNSILAKSFNPIEDEELSTCQPLGKHPFFHKDMTAPYYRTYKRAMLRRNQVFAASEDHFIGSRKSFVPQLGKLIWQTPNKNPFYAYLFLNKEGKKIGYVRIPHYACGTYNSNQFAKIINKFEAETDALIVDQVNNPGGSLFYMLSLVSMLADKPLELPKHKITITQEDVYFSLENQQDLIYVKSDQEARDLFGEDIGGYPVDYEFVQSLLKHLKFIVNEWNAGRSVTDADYLDGIDFIKPNPNVHYTKPIIVLVNELDFSCGDLLPAILQDNKRATIVGTRTAGAGGYVLPHSYPNLFGIEGFSYTGSIAQRLDLKPIENLGVDPDVKIELTEKDLQKNYPDYVSKVNEILSGLLK